MKEENALPTIILTGRKHGKPTPNREVLSYEVNLNKSNHLISAQLFINKIHSKTSHIYIHVKEYNFMHAEESRNPSENFSRRISVEFLRK